jgi:hypothetical protein
VQWGVDRRVVAELRERCGVRASPACVVIDRVLGVVWIEPTASVEVQYNELMQGRLRDGVLRRVSTAQIG